MKIPWIDRKSAELNNALTDERIIALLKSDIKQAKKKAAIIEDLEDQLCSEFDDLEEKRISACGHLVWYHKKEDDKRENSEEHNDVLEAVSWALL